MNITSKQSLLILDHGTVAERQGRSCEIDDLPALKFTRAALEAEFARLNGEVERLTVARAEMSLSLAGALRRIRELEGMLETERSTDDTDNGYDTESEV